MKMKSRWVSWIGFCHSFQINSHEDNCTADREMIISPNRMEFYPQLQIQKNFKTNFAGFLDFWCWRLFQQCKLGLFWWSPNLTLYISANISCCFSNLILIYIQARNSHESSLNFLFTKTFPGCFLMQLVGSYAMHLIWCRENLILI